MSFVNNITWSPEKYAETAVVAREAGNEMLSRLDWMTIQPQVILDVGCGVSESSRQLAARYPQAKVISLEQGLSLLPHAQYVLCDQAALSSFDDQSVDLLFANFFLPWYRDNLDTLLREWKRIMRPEGLLMFTALGTNTMRECHHLVDESMLPVRMDMHDLGDKLLQMGWSDPVLDVCEYTITYRDKEKMLGELCASGMLAARTDVNVFAPLEKNAEAVYSLTFEIIFAHAFKAMPKERQEKIAKVPVSSIVRGG